MTISVSAVSDRVAALRLTTELIPVSGPGGPVSPATYSRSEADPTEPFARSTNVPIPGAVDERGAPRRGDAVIIDSLAAQAHNISVAMRSLVEELSGSPAPGFVVGMPTQEVIAAGVAGVPAATLSKAGLTAEQLEQELRWALAETVEAGEVSDWTASHRHADSAIRFANDPATGEQAWSGGPVGELIRSLRPGSGSELARHAPAAALLGYWLSSRSPRRHRLARSLTAEVVGYGAVDIKRGHTKGDVFGAGGAPSDVVSLSANADGTSAMWVVPKKPGKPAAFGFGQIPGESEPVAVTCERVERMVTISAQSLRSQLRDGSAPVDPEVIAVLVDLGLLSAIESDGGFFRSGTDLVPVPGARVLVAVLTDGSVVALDVDEQVRAARERLVAVTSGGWFAEPVAMQMSRVQVDLVLARIVADAAKGGPDAS